MERYLALKTIVETGTFTAAAEKLGYTQPALSQNIAALEAELGLVLLNRSRGGAGLSADGEEIYPYVLKLLNAGESLRHKAQEMQGLENSVIRVGAFTSISIYWLPQLMKGFMELYPNVEFKISTGDDRVNEELIKNGEIDFGFVTETPSMDLPHRIICENSLDVVLPVGHPLAGKKTVKIEDLKDEPLINNESGPSSEPLEMFEERGITPNVKYVLENDEAVLSMVEAGLGVSILSEVSIENTSREVLSRRLSPPLKRVTTIAYRDEKLLPLAARKFIDYIIENL